MTRKPCSEQRDPRQLVIACKCDSCEGELRGDRIGVLICSACGCIYAISTTRESAR